MLWGLTLLVPGALLIFIIAGDAIGCGWSKIPNPLIWK